MMPQKPSGSELSLLPLKMQQYAVMCSSQNRVRPQGNLSPVKVEHYLENHMHLSRISVLTFLPLVQRSHCAMLFFLFNLLTTYQFRGIPLKILWYRFDPKSKPLTMDIDPTLTYCWYWLLLSTSTWWSLINLTYRPNKREFCIEFLYVRCWPWFPRLSIS